MILFFLQSLDFHQKQNYFYKTVLLMYGWAVKPEHPGPQTTKISSINYDKNR